MAFVSFPLNFTFWDFVCCGVGVIGLILMVKFPGRHNNCDMRSLCSISITSVAYFLTGEFLILQCMCSDCAKELRLQTNKCPICRQPIEELIEIKINNVDQ